MENLDLTYIRVNKFKLFIYIIISLLFSFFSIFLSIKIFNGYELSDIYMKKFFKILNFSDFFGYFFIASSTLFLFSALFLIRKISLPVCAILNSKGIWIYNFNENHPLSWEKITGIKSRGFFGSKICLIVDSDFNEKDYARKNPVIPMIFSDINLNKMEKIIFYYIKKYK
ncbi:hypothetical protein [Govanella unica]|uniref:Uncharacterized protein n=1 Tax=Govanella unica TaxID=2975056 RepID=A0A9X3TYE5_9PROT|nr:hypothetical protein [Govania unica]MDA5193672.1 hypothetical protein [Govania unica]